MHLIFIEGIRFPKFLQHPEIFEYDTMLKWEDEHRSEVFEGVNIILKCSGQGLQENVEVVIRPQDGHTECGKQLNRLHRHGLDSALDTGLRNGDASAMEGTDDMIQRVG